MLPVYEATAIHAPNLEGGTTRPCILEVEDINGRAQGCYVVKIFPPKQEMECATAKEAFANVLSKEFGLQSPQGALINVTTDIIKELQTEYNYPRTLTEGYYFGSEYISNVGRFDSSLFAEKFDTETRELIFAFDMLIQNTDRRLTKSNVLISYDGAGYDEIYLIDHEVSLDIQKTFAEYVELNIWKTLPTARGEHICLASLKKESKKGGVEFNLFEEYLRTLRLNNLRTLDNQLQEHNIATDKLATVFPYLRDARSQSYLFSKHLQSLLV